MTRQIEELFADLARATAKTDLVVFAGRVGGRFMDNVKYLFRHCLVEKQPFKPVFLTHHKTEQAMLAKAGLPSLLFPSDEAVHLLPKARLVVCDDFWWKTQTPAYHLLREARTLQMWHGIPLKLIGFPEIESDLNMPLDKAEKLRFGYSGYDAVLSTSPFVTRTSLGRVFQTREMWETGYPRNDALFREPDAIDLLGVDQESLRTLRTFRAGGFRTVFFMPTFRDTGGDAFSDGALDLAALDAFGRKHKILFLLKFHPYLTLSASLGLKTVHLVRSDSDAYPLLRLADCLLTDYSSVAYDFLLTDKPVVFFPYDLQKYLSRDRGMFASFEEMAPGPRPVDQEGLFAALRAVLAEGRDEHAAERRALRDRLHAHADGQSARRVAERLVATFFA